MLLHAFDVFAAPLVYPDLEYSRTDLIHWRYRGTETAQARDNGDYFHIVSNSELSQALKNEIAHSDPQKWFPSDQIGGDPDQHASTPHLGWMEQIKPSNACIRLLSTYNQKAAKDH